MKIICIIKGWYRSFPFIGFPISGCDFIEQENGNLVCEVCGDSSETI